MASSSSTFKILTETEVKEIREGIREDTPRQDTPMPIKKSPRELDLIKLDRPPLEKMNEIAVRRKSSGALKGFKISGQPEEKAEAEKSSLTPRK